MKLYKLIVHNKNFSGEDLIINPKDFPNLRKGDIVEIYHPEDEFSRLLLQITSFKEDLQGRETISVETSIAGTFQLRTYADVCFNVVNPDSVALDSVELTFKDQYLGRSEMWRLKNSLVNTCVYLNKKIEFCGGSVRCQVYEMWSQGERVACGVITDDTKVVFRSSTSMVYLFLQMSSEMWDFDIHGDLYFEKAVNGFMADLFQKWKKHGSNHEVTIVLFSRCFYAANSLGDFPEYMRECMQQDYKGRYYEDFYRVAVQNERYDDWTPVLVQLRKLFMEYQRTVLEYHERPGIITPKPINSTAAQGNFLEVLNMSLNVFEKHYLDRSFDRTGQLSVVITPGVGVFDVDRELTNVTKQRIIDNGVGCDLVCVGEQPLHAVPLLKFHNKDTSITADDYSMPHWINLSFYSTNKKVAYSSFVPRIKLPPRRNKQISSTPPTSISNICSNPSAANNNNSSGHSNNSSSTSNSNSSSSSSNIDNNTNTTTGQQKSKSLCEDDSPLDSAAFDYDAYDAQVFTMPSVHTSSLNRFSRLTKKTSVSSALDTGNSNKIMKRKMSDPDIHHSQSSDRLSGDSSPIIGTSHTAAINIPLSAESPPELKSTDLVDGPVLSRTVAGSVGSPSTHLSSPPTPRPGRALINPFDPSHITIKLTSNRRRWTHIFPKGPTGVLIQQHHYQAVPSCSSSNDMMNNNSSNKHSSTAGHPHKILRSASQTAFHDHSRMKSRPSVLTISGASPLTSYPPSRKIPMTLLWGATGEQEWTPALTTGVDWKSLTIPACLPITTDYFPDEHCLKNDYVFSDYNLLPDDVNADYAQQRAIYRKPLSTQEVFQELVSQRLAQGFQLIVECGNSLIAGTPGQTSNTTSSATSAVVGPRTQDVEPAREFKLSIGRVFHRIVLNGSEIRVTRYRPRHPYPPFSIHYRYRFQAPDHDTYEVSWVSFNTEKLENYNWNYLDHYICTRGDTDFALAESLKYWRYRVYVLPLCQSPTRKILDGSEHCDLYAPMTLEEKNHLAESFLRFIETWVNKIRRPSLSKKHKLDLSSLNTVPSHPTRRRHSTSIMYYPSYVQGNVVGSSPFRERLGSNRLPDKPRPRSGSKVLERGRASPAMEMIMAPLTSSFDNDHNDANDQDSLSPLDNIMLKDSASLVEIFEAMKHPVSGLSMLSTHTSLPSNVFVSSDSIQWLLSHMEGIVTYDDAINVLEALRKEKFICHASGDYTFPFIGGFYLYFFVSQDKDKEQSIVLGDLQSFENEWLEVELLQPQPPPTIPVFLDDKLPPTCGQSDNKDVSPTYKQTHLEIDIQGKSDRVEWGHGRYHAQYNTDQAYELTVQWVAASGPIVSELVTGWARKAQSSGMQMIPVPADPFALPYALKSDPLRGPVFVRLDTECLMGSKSYLFEEFPEETWAQRLILFQEAIAFRFGFLTCVTEKEKQHHHNQYIHLSGNVFLMIPSMPCNKTRSRATSISRTNNRTTRTARYQIPEEVAASPHHEYITRHVGLEEYGPDTRVGFLWSWNHMVSRKWKWSSTPATSDEAFQNKLLSDFRSFCNNSNNRLKVFWSSCLTQLKIAKSSPVPQMQSQHSTVSSSSSTSSASSQTS
ncbi:GATOR complex protein Iml1 isoform X2 [Lycorma delicatula]|uniref:GATOR complex protein Iml1 isoform X2 n=1 Tax=Lycorma delicatula TaxID=130591 RepID=UPI003F517ECE